MPANDAPRAYGASDPIGDAFAARRPTPAPFMPSSAPAVRPTPGSGMRSPVGTPAAGQRLQTPPAQPRMATPPAAQPRVATPPASPRVPTPMATPRMVTPAMGSPAPGASLPPLRTTPRTPWQASSAITLPPMSMPPTSVPPVSVPPVTPPAPSPAPVSTPAATAPAVTPAGGGERRPINPFLARDPAFAQRDSRARSCRTWWRIILQNIPKVWRRERSRSSSGTRSRRATRSMLRRWEPTSRARRRTFRSR